MEQKTGIELLAYCLGLGTYKTESARLEQFSNDDWYKVINQAAQHGVFPLLYQRLITYNLTNNMPASVLQDLREMYHYQSLRSMSRYHELSRLLKILQKDRIPVIVLKGAALAELIYKNIALRPMADVDLLVKIKDVWSIHRILLKLGYSFISVDHKHIGYKNNFAYVEVHIKIIEFPDANLWNNASALTIAQTDTLALGAENLLLHLCLHLYHHFNIFKSTKLIWLFDIAEVLKHYQNEIDWDYIIKASKKHKKERIIYSVLLLINELFNINVPSTVLNQFEDIDIVITSNDILHPLDLTISVSLQPDFLSGNIIYRVFRRIFPSKNFIIRRYSVKHQNFYYLYYFVHIARAFISFCKLFILFCKIVANLVKQQI